MVVHLGDFYRTNKRLASLIKLSVRRQIRDIKTDLGGPADRKRQQRNTSVHVLLPCSPTGGRWVDYPRAQHTKSQPRWNGLSTHQTTIWRLNASPVGSPQRNLQSQMHSLGHSGNTELQLPWNSSRKCNWKKQSLTDFVKLACPMTKAKSDSKQPQVGISWHFDAP